MIHLQHEYDKISELLKDLNDKDSQLKFQSKYGIILDTNVVLKGIDVYLIAPLIIVPSKCVIDLSGIDCTEKPIPAQPNKRPEEGKLGMNGGHLYIYGHIIGPDNIQFISKGGDGGPGQDASNPKDADFVYFPFLKYFDECKKLNIGKCFKDIVYNLGDMIPTFRQADQTNEVSQFVSSYYSDFKFEDLWNKIFIDMICKRHQYQYLNYFNPKHGGIIYLVNQSKISNAFKDYVVCSNEDSSVLVEAKKSKNTHTYGTLTIDERDPSILIFNANQNTPRNLNDHKYSSWSVGQRYRVSAHFEKGQSLYEEKICELGIIENYGYDGTDAYEGGKGGRGGFGGQIFCWDDDQNKKIRVINSQYPSGIENGECDQGRNGSDGQNGLPTGNVSSKRLYLAFIPKQGKHRRQRLLIFYAHKDLKDGELITQKEPMSPKISSINKNYMMEAISQELELINTHTSKFQESVFSKYISSSLFASSYSFGDVCHLCGKLFSMLNNYNISSFFAQDCLMSICQRLPTIMQHELSQKKIEASINAFTRWILLFLFKKAYIYRDPVFVTDVPSYINYFGLSIDSNLKEIKNDQIIKSIESENINNKIVEINECIKKIEDKRETIMSIFKKCEELLQKASFETKGDIEDYIDKEKEEQNKIIENKKWNCVIEGISGSLCVAMIGFSYFAGPAAPLISGIGCETINFAKTSITNKSITGVDFSKVLSAQASYTDEKYKLLTFQHESEEGEAPNIYNINVNLQSNQVLYVDSQYEVSKKDTHLVSKETYHAIQTGVQEMKSITGSISTIRNKMKESEEAKRYIEELTEIKKKHEENILKIVDDSKSTFEHVRDLFNETKESDGTVFTPKKDLSSIHVSRYDLNNYFQKLKNQLILQLTKLNELRQSCHMNTLNDLQNSLTLLLSQVQAAIKAVLNLQTEIIHANERNQMENLITNLQSVEKIELGEYATPINLLIESLFKSEQSMILSNLKRSFAAHTFPFVYDFDENESLRNHLDRIMLNSTTISRYGNYIEKVNHFPFSYFRYSENPKLWDDFLNGQEIMLDVLPVWKQINAIKLKGFITLVIYVDGAPNQLNAVGFAKCIQGPDNYYVWSENTYTIPVGTIGIYGLMDKCVVRPLEEINEIYALPSSIKLDAPKTKYEPSAHYINKYSEDTFQSNERQMMSANSERIINAGVASPYSTWVLQLTNPIPIEQSKRNDMIIQMEGKCEFVRSDARIDDASRYYSPYLTMFQKI